MKTGFKDPIESEVKTKQIKSPWNFDAPPYDERSSCYVNAGSHYGEGFKQPVGTKGAPTVKGSVIPYGRINTMKVDEVPKKNVPIDLQP